LKGRKEELTNVQALDEIEEDLVAGILYTWSSPRYQTRERLMYRRRSKTETEERNRRREISFEAS